MHRDVATHTTKEKGVVAGETSGEVEGGRAVAHFERVQQVFSHKAACRAPRCSLHDEFLYRGFLGCAVDGLQRLQRRVIGVV